MQAGLIQSNIVVTKSQTNVIGNMQLILTNLQFIPHSKRLGISYCCYQLPCGLWYVSYGVAATIS